MRERVDRLLVERGLAPSRARARALIDAGKVRKNGVLVLRPSALAAVVDELAIIELDHPYVSRGGLKLEGALADLALDVRGLVIADIGASTGGFTDCALRCGAARVYAIDVGHAQLHVHLRADPRVICMEGVNARYLDATSLPESIDLVVVDASFIGLAKLLPALTALLHIDARLLALVKPQFELGPQVVSRRGVVSDDVLRQQALAEVVSVAAGLGLELVGSVDSRLSGPEGNREIFALFTRGCAERSAGEGA